MVKSVAPPQTISPIVTTNPAAASAATSSATDPNADSGEDAKQAQRNTASTKADAFEGVARQITSAQASSLTGALTAGLNTSDEAAQLLGSFAKDALIGDMSNQNAASGLLTSAQTLQSLSVPQLNQLLEGVLGQLAQLAQELGQPLNADALTLLATLNGQPASLLDGQTEATVLWRAMALSNQPLSVFTLAATGPEVDAHSGLLPNQAYRVLGTFVDGKNERQVRLAPGAAGATATDEESMLAQALSVPFSSLQRAILLALIGDGRIDMPYAQELDETQGPGQANCCMFAHGTGAARGTGAVSQRPTSLSEPRCRSCTYARQLCLPEE